MCLCALCYPLLIIASIHYSFNLWITEPLCTKLRHKNQLHAIATSSNDDNIMKEYKEAKKVLHATLRNLVTSYVGDELELNKNDIFKTWKVLKDIIGLDGNKTKQKFNILINDKLVIDSLDIANGFNNCFVSVGPKLANNLKSGIDPSGAYAGFLKGGGAQL